MREEYRAWDKKLKLMGHHVVGVVPGGSFLFKQPEVDMSWHWGFDQVRRHPEQFVLIGPSELAGNYKEVFEGDIVHIPGWPHPAQIKRKGGDGSLAIITSTGEWLELISIKPTEDFKVVGNIYETPELLGGKKRTRRKVSQSAVWSSLIIEEDNLDAA